MSPEAADSRAARLFAVVWSLAILFHQASYSIAWQTPLSSAVTLAALITLVTPGSTITLLTLASVQLLECGTSLPFVSNHWLLTAAVNLLLLQSAIALRLRGRKVESGALFLRAAPAGRALLLVLYFFAVLHKLNTDFLDPEVSCASVHFQRVAPILGLPDALTLRWLAIAGTLVVESAIPLMLLFPRTRVMGLLMGLVLHGVLATDPGDAFFNFSSVVYALYVFFLPPELLARVSLPAVVPQSQTRSFLVTTLWRLVVIALTATLLDLREGARTAFLVYLALAIATLLWLERGRVEPWPRLTAPRGLMWVIPALLLMNGFSPYLGLKTETSFAMFSNLRTEGGRSNSLVVPRTIQIADFQDELIRPISSSDAEVAHIAQRGLQLTRFELRALLSKNPKASVELEDARGRRTLEHAASDPELVRPVSWIERKLLYFRPVDGSERAHCSH